VQRVELEVVDVVRKPDERADQTVRRLDHVVHLRQRVETFELLLAPVESHRLELVDSGPDEPVVDGLGEPETPALDRPCQAQPRRECIDPPHATLLEAEARQEILELEVPRVLPGPGYHVGDAAGRIASTR
jgi:hypothetical protein